MPRTHRSPTLSSTASFSLRRASSQQRSAPTLHQHLLPHVPPLPAAFSPLSILIARPLAALPTSSSPLPLLSLHPPALHLLATLLPRLLSVPAADARLPASGGPSLRAAVLHAASRGATRPPGTRAPTPKEDAAAKLAAAAAAVPASVSIRHRRAAESHFSPASLYVVALAATFVAYYDTMTRLLGVVDVTEHSRAALAARASLNLAAHVGGGKGGRDSDIGAATSGTGGTEESWDQEDSVSSSASFFRMASTRTVGGPGAGAGDKAVPAPKRRPRLRSLLRGGGGSAKNAAPAEGQQEEAPFLLLDHHDPDIPPDFYSGHTQRASLVSASSSVGSSSQLATAQGKRRQHEQAHPYHRDSLDSLANHALTHEERLNSTLSSTCSVPSTKQRSGSDASVGKASGNGGGSHTRRFGAPFKLMSATRSLRASESYWLADIPTAAEDQDHYLLRLCGFVPEYMRLVRSADDRRAFVFALAFLCEPAHPHGQIPAVIRHIMSYILARAAESPPLAAHAAFLAVRYGADLVHLQIAGDAVLLHDMRAEYTRIRRARRGGGNGPISLHASSTITSTSSGPGGAADFPADPFFDVDFEDDVDDLYAEFERQDDEGEEVTGGEPVLSAQPEPLLPQRPDRVDRTSDSRQLHRQSSLSAAASLFVPNASATLEDGAISSRIRAHERKKASVKHYRFGDDFDDNEEDAEENVSGDGSGSFDEDSEEDSDASSTTAAGARSVGDERDLDEAFHDESGDATVFRRSTHGRPYDRQIRGGSSHVHDVDSFDEENDDDDEDEEPRLPTIARIPDIDPAPDAPVVRSGHHTQDGEFEVPVVHGLEEYDEAPPRPTLEEQTEYNLENFHDEDEEDLSLRSDPALVRKAMEIFSERDVALLVLAHETARSAKRATRSAPGAVGSVHLSADEVNQLTDVLNPAATVEAVTVISIHAMLQRWTAIYPYRPGALENTVRRFVQGPIGHELGVSTVGQRGSARDRDISGGRLRPRVQG